MVIPKLNQIDRDCWGVRRVLAVWLFRDRSDVLSRVTRPFSALDSLLRRAHLILGLAASRLILPLLGPRHSGIFLETTPLHLFDTRDVI